MIAALIFWSSLLTILYVYVGYYLCLRLLVYIYPNSNKPASSHNNPKPLKVSIIIAVYNEEDHIEKRINNILELSYAGEVETIVASDGSSDKTVEIAAKYCNRGVKVLDFKKNRGRALTHNDAVSSASGDILLFTDAETEFAPDFLQHISEPFENDHVGCAVGRLHFIDKESGITKAEGFYWKWEVRTRIMEDRIGILMTGTGACTAFRRELFRPMRPIDDVDFAFTVDVINSGKQVIYIQSAKAYDKAPSSLKEELNGRIRSSKRLVGTFSRWGIRNCLRHPLYSWGLVSHKLLRWLTPVFLILVFISNLFLIGATFYNFTFYLYLTSILLVVIGFAGHLLDKRIPLASILFSFALANLGFAIGLYRIFTGRIPVKYGPQ